MKTEANTPEEYITNVPDEWKEAIARLRFTILKNLPEGFSESISYGMIGYVVPKSIYPAGYHCTPELPLPFINIAAQKNFIALYHMGIYADKKLLDWFTKEYPKNCKTKLDMGKSCIRFKKTSDIPFDLIARLVQKVSVEKWIQLYEKNVKN